jgi:hypothetical protein
LEKKTKRKGKERKLKDGAKSSVEPFPQVVKIISIILSPSSCVHTIFCAIPPISSLCALNLVIDIQDLCIFMYEINLYPHMIIADRKFGWLRPLFFYFKLSFFHVKTICALVS